ncbi:MAG: hypothetical protein F6K40_16140 [Okeania sp. SIO3I5]|uniref:hypothetical protein n=1 Tax=Okeania sp. SIO3I5 TaxID=2607805 RepID=UPI0013BE5387|nr:hypothetical protein [Okeania sp. SIO3I5]NEQ37711.1 hypothetical protein [Okeania sp. SIO3I5]
MEKFDEQKKWIERLFSYFILIQQIQNFENFGKKLTAESCFFMRKQGKIIRRAELFH